MKNFDTLYSFLNQNKNLLESQGLDIEYIDTHYGDYMYEEASRGFKFKFEESIYRVCHTKVTEDSEDWGQSESYLYEECKKDDKHISPEEVLKILLNYKALKRNNTIEKLLD